jgi:hypothetical protein
MSRGGPSVGSEESLEVGVVVCLLVGLGCYRPTIQDGGFKCNADGKLCPDGFECDPADMVCRRPGNLGGARDASDGPADAGADAGLDPDAMCFQPVPGCTAATGICDPFCQTGCACGEKCLSGADGGLLCNRPLAGALKKAGDACDISAPGTRSQSDNCGPGLVCVDDSCNGRCYRYCRSDGDCPDSTCTRSAGGAKVCDVPTVACDPVGRGATTSCASSAQGCYLADVGGGADAGGGSDRTLCDCPFGAAPEGGTCVSTRDCLPGLVCVAAGDAGGSQCQPVCALDGSGACTSGRTCVALNGSTKYGTCSP